MSERGRLVRMSKSEMSLKIWVKTKKMFETNKNEEEHISVNNNYSHKQLFMITVNLQF